MLFQGENRFSFIAAVWLLAVLVVLLGALMGQQVYGSIYGSVVDKSGAGVPNASISITELTKNIQAKTETNESGNYRLGQLIPGTYRVEVEAKGFRKSVTDTEVRVDQAARADFALELGAVTETVEVTAATPVLQSDRSDVATTFSSRELIDLPSFDRNFQAHLLLSPGTNQLGWQHASSENPQGSHQITVNGQPFSATGFQLDGTDNQDPILGIIVINPVLDSVTETKIAAQNYDAEFGMANAGIVLTSTKSGSNDLHGSAFEYLRDNTPGFQTFARNPFNSAEDTQVPPVKWNQFGGTIGGAVIKNKLFYFGDAQLTRRRTGSSVLTAVPTERARSGDFGEYLYTDSGGTVHNAIYDPLTGNADGTGRTQFPGNVIPQNRLSPEALAIMKFLPAPNAVDQGGTTFRNNYAATGSENFDSNQWDTRWDYFINDKSSLFGRYSYAGFNKSAPGAFGVLPGGPALDNINFAGLSDVLNQSIAIGYTRTFSPTLINDFRFGFMRYRVKVTPNGLGTHPATDAGIPNLNTDNFYTSGMPAFFVQGDAGTNLGYSLGTNQCNCPLNEQEQQFQFVDNLTKTVGNHTLKFGADLRHATNLRVPSDVHRAGELTFDTGYTGIVPGAGQGVQEGLGWATFMLGEVTSFGRFVSNVTDAAERQNRFFWYAQDSWRVSRKLQVNYGLRWEMIFPEYVNKAGNGALPDLNTGMMEVFGVGKVPIHGPVTRNWKNFAPRLGITYQINDKTVVRIGYGWTYSVGVFGSNFGHIVTQNPPVLASQSVNANGAFQGVFALNQGPPTATIPAPGSDGTFPIPDGIFIRSRPGQITTPRVMVYNATVQHQFGNSLSVSAGYVGNSGRHTFVGDGDSIDINQASWDPNNPGTDYNSRRPYFQKFGWTQGVQYECSCTTNQYNSLQIQVDKRFSRGYTIQSNYTYQVAKGDADGWSFLYDRPLGRGNRDGITRQTFNFTNVWEIPFGRNRHYGRNMSRWADLTVGGWNLSGVLTIYSGRPFTPNIGTFPGGALRPDTGPNGRPVKGPGDPYSGAQHNRAQWFVGGVGDGKPFEYPTDNQFGNYPYNGMFGPRQIQQDLSLGKDFKITESKKINIRAEAFNAWNHTNLGDPNSDVSADNAGQITGLAPNVQMRRLQFGFRFEF